MVDYPNDSWASCFACSDLYIFNRVQFDLFLMSVFVELWCLFSVLVAEVVKHYYPHLVEIHNYASAHSVSKKSVNWHILNRWIDVLFSSCKQPVRDTKSETFLIRLLHFAKNDR